MCNIAGYVGNRRAAPILIEMLRAQEEFDGCMGTGIVTIHEGKLYCRKVIGDVETLLRETDALSLPGTVGIIHSRSCGKVGQENLLHPFTSTIWNLPFSGKWTISGLSSTHSKSMPGWFTMCCNSCTSKDGLKPRFCPTKRKSA